MRCLAVVLILINVICAVSAFYVLRSSGQGAVDDSSLIRLRRSGILFGKLARNWAADDKRVVLRPLVEYEPDPWH
ncbi:Protein CBG17878 [Caenorhabditis briggsae]|uniref:Uncharacterized protein n=2 Tax=Caenorhabditis briggsae TaxID=6238 RepID=A0AAE9JLJ3_CAEBR|nr:Protein CBG17878 [Caenorhabditis briggsae]ULT87721.1 hypothetical protein L3Y34_007118 [Caenorhabditis briggsae]UMM33505.1 hypothetical protein L5515_006961 [Caenorhabditis briggsae]CAP35421.1 Protein CBG17878 [Caenorhabditis briggsae]